MQLCISAANQPNALFKLPNLLGFEEKKVLINSSFYSNWNYCPLVWMLAYEKSIPLKDFKSAQWDSRLTMLLQYDKLLNKSGLITIDLITMRSLHDDEIYKTLTIISPMFYERNL